MPYQWPLLPATTRTLDRAEAGVADLLQRLPKPTLAGPAGHEWFQFAAEDQSWVVVAALKLVRAVSGLRAAKRLGETGYTHEMAVLFRTVDDFLDEVSFLVEGYGSDPPTKQASKFVVDFFAEPFLNTEELHQDRRGPKRVERSKVRAAEGRLLDPLNPDGPRRSAMAVDSVWDSYVHGGYPPVMELYSARKGFHMAGMAGTIRVPQYRNHLAYYVYRLLAVGTTVAYAIRDTSLGDRLRADAREYGRSDEYPDDSSEVTGLPRESS